MFSSSTHWLIATIAFLAGWGFAVVLDWLLERIADRFFGDKPRRKPRRKHRNQLKLPEER